MTCYLERVIDDDISRHTPNFLIESINLCMEKNCVCLILLIYRQNLLFPRKFADNNEFKSDKVLLLFFFEKSVHVAKKIAESESVERIYLKANFC